MQRSNILSEIADESTRIHDVYFGRARVRQSYGLGLVLSRGHGVLVKPNPERG